mgnify:CR=1 FL=1
MGTLFADGYSAAEIQELLPDVSSSEFAQLQIPKAGLFDSKRFSLFLEATLADQEHRGLADSDGDCRDREFGV